MLINNTITSAALSLCLLLLAAPVQALKSDRDKPLEIGADESEFDADTGFTLIVGNVEIHQGSLEIYSDEARVYMQGGRMSRILLDGNPATWKQQLEGGDWMDAKSAQIDYDVNAEQILLIGDAVVVHPQGEITGDRISYDLAAEKLRSDSTSGGRIKMRIEPDVVESETSKAGKSTDGNGNDTDDDSETSESADGSTDVAANDAANDQR